MDVAGLDGALAKGVENHYPRTGYTLQSVCLQGSMVRSLLQARHLKATRSSDGQKGVSRDETEYRVHPHHTPGQVALA